MIAPGMVRFPEVNTGPFSFGARKGTKGKLNFYSWLREVSPTWTWNWKYQLYIQQYLEKITNGTIKRLMLFVPPRHGKSEMVTVRYPVWRLEQDPTMRVIVGAYNQTLAERFSRKMRKIARARFELSNERTAAEDWETSLGGGVRAAGVGAGVTGMGGNLIVIDDPVKNRKEASSKVYRDAVYDWYTDDLYTRQEPGAAIILIMTRWHEDDLAGRILASEDGPNWTVINLPAEAEANDPLGRNPGEALCPERYPLPELAKIKTVLKRSYWALYQQRPQEQEGDFFKRSWFERVEIPQSFDAIVRYWDKAATANDGDYTAGVLVGRLKDTYYVVDVVRGQWSTGERDRIIKQTASEDAAKYSNVVTWSEQEPGSSGVDSALAFVKLLDGLPVQVEKVTGDKAVRAEPLASQAEYGFVKANKQGKWFDNWIDELTSFPNGANDDQVDGTSGAYSKLAVNTWLIT